MKDHQLAFENYQAVSKLKELAKRPFNLTADGHLSVDRVRRYRAQSCGYTLLYSCERVDDEIMHNLVELAKEADLHEKMFKMQSGEVLNFIQGFESENRSVLHTATRDFFEHPHLSPRAMEAAKKCRQEIEKLKKFIEKIDKENRFTDLVMVAIGGSELGPRAVFLGLEHLLQPGRRIHFVSNIDPDAASCVLKDLELKKTLVVIVTKGGSTLETQTNEAWLRDHFQQAGLAPELHFVMVTAQYSPMDNPKNYYECFYMFEWIGGRFSVTSMGGAVMLAFAFGFNVYWEFLKGANAMDKAALHKDIQTNLPLLGALLSVWNRNFLKYPTLALIPYSQALSRYSAHIQQVEMESNGKHISKEGIKVTYPTAMTIWGEPGTNAQHSFYQMIHQGTDIVPIEFIGFKHCQNGQDFNYKGTTSQEKLLANLFAQMIALAQGQKHENPNKVFEGNRPSHLLLADQLTPFAMGALIAYHEHKVAFEGFIWGVNSFDQEGVQLGKVLADKILKCFIETHEGKPHSSYPLADAFLQELQK